MTNNSYEQNSLTRLIFIFGLLSILSLMIEMLTGIVDTGFAGNLPLLLSIDLNDLTIDVGFPLD